MKAWSEASGFETRKQLGAVMTGDIRVGNYGRAATDTCLLDCLTCLGEEAFFHQDIVGTVPEIDARCRHAAEHGEPDREGQP